MGPGQGGSLRSAAGRWWPELLVGVLACATFLGCLGSVELWGKREQRAAAEALDTVLNGHWLVAEIQGRPRLEKPPLPRWAVAGLLLLTGRREEWVVRLPSALSGLACVALVYALGRRIGGRELGLASAVILGTTGLFISELRQAGNDGPLAAFTALAVFAAWRRIHKEGDGAGEDAPGGRGWAVLFHVAMGLGFLCKGPIVLMLVGVAVLPYLMLTGRLRVGLRRLWDPAGVLAFLAMAIAWPALVLAADPEALGVWTTEMGQKTGALPLAHRERGGLLLSSPLMMLPWAVVGIVGAAVPFRADRGLGLPWRRGDAWLPWCWTIGNLGLLGTWAVAKPNYFVPCLPGLALLGGMAWIRLDALARSAVPAASRRARRLLHLQWGILALAGVVVAAACRGALSAAPPGWLALLAVMPPAAAALGARARGRGRGAVALLPAAAATAAGVLIGYGILGPGDDRERGHRHLAEQIARLAPAGADAGAAELRFFHEIDEGLWFYLGDRRLAPVPGSQPRYSDSYDKLGNALTSGSNCIDPAAIAARFEGRQRRVLRDWIDRRPPAAGPAALLIRVPLLERWSADLAGRAAPLVVEENRKRTPLALLRVVPDAAGIADASR
ncbi:Undecaprenyl phosphate-alpha-4-amino-4-deoxy-L-arabinose arabinosyl transferase [Aquisphaera giovannonii]|uniref:Undecaprenyl phosphate-alpha-4-amino-4-deoxy-L-arabinose arabinosyl transferase n=1 Tax=Aquisphaera giovannonii TaxID=406548 RepID=A0A5B9W6W6_9BACT|nr:glycosyltransferase family 39 protein [Aquisphaera giovannonii]QEH35741.1 Undecaprenyl phosphate-alpha-4-amino-4-deoxy-L-arabinose arabinosyl transferase [Aquisphaera giovannonii]